MWHQRIFSHIKLLLFTCAVLFSAGFSPFSVRQLLQYDLLEHLPKVQSISTSASKEASLEKALVKMQADWQGVELRILEYKDTATSIIGGVDEVQTLLDDHIVKTQAMRSNPSIKPLEATTLAWEKLLLDAQAWQHSLMHLGTCMQLQKLLAPTATSVTSSACM